MHAKSKNKIRVLVVEDHILIRMGLVTASEVEPDLAVVAEAEDGEEAIASFRKHLPDVVVMDLRLPGMSGIETMRALHKEFGPVPILVLTTYGADEDIYQAVQAGASGYVLKDMPLKRVVEAIRAIYSGQQYFPPEIAGHLAERLKHSMLTPRELSVLQMIAEGRSNKEIGVALGIVEGTVKVHVTSLISKLGAMDRTQAVTTALKRGIIHLK
jgi:DNA-binding NarL/FixJ family response regulator